MKADDFRAFTEYYDQFYLQRKNYEKEANIVKRVITELERKKSRTLLDVGCGTGEHLKYFSLDFQCTGIDINRRMIEIARNKVPKAKFKVANMINLGLKDKFDVITCLFSSIGYVKSLSNLEKTFENFHKHLNEKGLVIVEPWIFKKDFKKDHISLDTYEDEELKFVRMGTSKINGPIWTIFMHYLVGKKGEIRYFREVHEMLASNYQDYVNSFNSVGFKDVKYLTENLWNKCRGLFVATST